MNRCGKSHTFHESSPRANQRFMDNLSARSLLSTPFVIIIVVIVCKFNKVYIVSKDASIGLHQHVINSRQTGGLVKIERKRETLFF